MASRMRQTYGYWLRVLALQWPGLVYRCLLRFRCEADPSASSDASMSASFVFLTISPPPSMPPLPSPPTPPTSPLLSPPPPSPQPPDYFISPSPPPPCSPLSPEPLFPPPPSPPLPMSPPTSPPRPLAPPGLAEELPPAMCVYGGAALDVPLLPFVLVALAILLLVPVAIGMHIQRTRARRGLQERDVLEVFGRFYSAIRPSALGWEAAVFGQFALLSAISVLLPEHAEVQALMALVVLGLVWRLRAALRPQIVALYAQVAQCLDGLVLLFLLLAIIGHGVAHAEPLWTEADGQISYHLSECLAQGRVFDPADSTSGARCAKLIVAPALLAVLCMSAAVCVCSVLNDLRHHSALVSILRLPISQVDETDPQALSMSASQAALRLPPSSAGFSLPTSARCAPRRHLRRRRRRPSHSPRPFPACAT